MIATIEHTTKLRVTLVGSDGGSTILFSKSTLSAEETFLLNQQPLAQGNYVLVAELLDASSQQITNALYREKFNKPYSGPIVPVKTGLQMEGIKTGRMKLNDTDKQYLEALHDAEITQNDFFFGEFLNRKNREEL